MTLRLSDARSFIAFSALGLLLSMDVGKAFAQTDDNSPAIVGAVAPDRYLEEQLIKSILRIRELESELRSAEQKLAAMSAESPAVEKMSAQSQSTYLPQSGREEICVQSILKAMRDDDAAVDWQLSCGKKLITRIIAADGLRRFGSADMGTGRIPFVINTVGTVRLEASMKDNSVIPVNCSPQVYLSSENGFAMVFPMIEDYAEDRRKLRYKVELPEHKMVYSSSLRILTSASSECGMAQADPGLDKGKIIGIGTLDESGASFSVQFVPLDPALLIVLRNGSFANSGWRPRMVWRRQARALIEAAFESARHNFSQVIVAGYTDTSEYAVFLKVPKTQFREQLKRIKNDNEFGFNVDEAGEGLDAALQVDLEKQISELKSQGVSVLTVIYGREQSEGSVCDFGSLANNQFMERLGQSLIIDVLPTKAYNSALKSVRENEKASDAVIVTPESENFSSIDCVKYAGLIENRELSRLSNAFAMPLLKAEEDLSEDYRELSRKWIGGLLETAP